MAYEPVILEKNYVNSECTFVSSHGGTPVNVVDQDPDTKWTTSGANDDDTTATLDCTFKEDGVAIQRIIDTIVIVNCNLKNFLVQYKVGGGSWTTLLTVTGNAATTYYGSFASTAVDAVRISTTLTQVIDAEKYIGELVVSKLLITFDALQSSYQVRPRQKAKLLTFGNNSMKQVVSLWSTNRSQKYEATVPFTQLSAAIYAALSLLKESGRDFTWYPEPYAFAQEIYQVIWTSPLVKKYTSGDTTVGFDVALDLKEI